MTSTIKMEKTPYDRFCVSAYRTIEPNKIESGIIEYISVTGDMNAMFKKFLIASHVLTSSDISIHFRYKASATFIM